MAAAGATELRAIDSLRRAEFVGAATGFEQAAAHWAGRDRLHELACRWGAGEAMRQAGDLDRAVRLLRATLEAATEIGFEPLAARIRRSLRLAGERSASVVGRRVAAGALTGREREVLDLVERGRTNAEIARRMGLGRPTVARLLSNAMTKLGAESRTQAVVLAASVRR